ncbi:MAG: hypothetical protein K2Q18_05690, partial [Bdellovibrionales bacterium]|nr:hypothetical protein [Bdellovibrionales bacterium]
MRLFFFLCFFLNSTTILAQEKSGDFGDSAFVKLMNTFNGGEVPYPFESLMDSFGTGVKERGNILMVPNGRSLVKNSADYKNPRIIVNPLDHRSGTTQNDKEEWSERDKLISNLGIKNGDLYIGFAPNHKALEVISFNPTTNKYDFFVIEDYEPGKKPKVVSNPPLCLTCHQNGAPIFPTFPWGEMLGKTADNILEPAGVARHAGKNELMERVKAANPDRDTIEGINIKNPARFDVFKVVDFDVSIRGANTSLMNRNLCASLCDTSANQVQCKKDIFNFYKNTLLDGSRSNIFKAEVESVGSILKEYKKKVAKFSMKSNFIGIRNPYLTNVLTKDQDPATPRGETEDLKDYKKAIQGNNPEAMKKAVEMCFDNSQFAEAAKKLSSSDFRQFIDSKSTEDVLKLWPQNRNALSILASL